MLAHRLVTAGILIVFALMAIFFLPPLPFFALTLAVLAIAAWEWCFLIGLKKTWIKVAYVLVMLFCACVSIGLMAEPNKILALSSFWWIFVFRYVKRYPKSQEAWRDCLPLKLMMGFFALIPCVISLNLIRNVDMGYFFLIYLFMLTFGTDSGAYFAGRQWGKHKMSPNVSPGKTYQGMCGGVVVSIVLAIISGIIGHVDGVLWLWWLSIAVTTSFVSILGDLFISMLKRAQGIKDTGGILPGHGGILDRVDSLLASAPIFTLGLLMMEYYYKG
jgi:phosphatidate cytidylyltransferase